jgi:uncharacterized SAM-binding protein YcdF (DUF218 family)
MGVSRRRMGGRRSLKVWLALMILMLAMFPGSKSGALLLTAFWERSIHPLSAPAAKAAQAIVVLTGGEELLEETARLQRETGLPVLASGGDGEAVTIKTSLEKRLRTPVTWTEGDSLTTEQNAIFSAAILGKAKIQRIILVTHALHMRRARAMFIGQGFEVIPAPARFSSSAQFQWSDCLPSTAGLALAQPVLHELAGLAYYRMRQAIFWTGLGEESAQVVRPPINPL